MSAVFIIKFGPDQTKNCRRSNILKFPAPYGSVLTKISKCHNLLYILADRQKQLQPELPRDQHTYNKIWLKLNENWESSSLLRILTSEILQSALNVPKPNSRNRTSKVNYLCAL